MHRSFVVVGQTMHGIALDPLASNKKSACSRITKRLGLLLTADAKR